MTTTAKSNEFHGIYVAMVTPMNAAQEVDFDALGRFAEHLVEAGVHGLIPLGSTGEFYALDAAERRDVLARVIDAAGGRVPVLAGANAASTREVVAYSRAAQAAGADGLLLAPPYYSLPTADELFEHYRAVNDAVALPIMLYNYPARTGVDIDPELVERLAGLEHVRYIKESTGKLDRMETLIRRCGDRLGVFCGADGIALEAFALGVRGWVGGIANVFPRGHAELYRLAAVERNVEAARALADRMLPALRFIEDSGRYTQLVKAGCALQGHPVGPPRAPLRPAPPELTDRLAPLLEGLD